MRPFAIVGPIHFPQIRIFFIGIGIIIVIRSHNASANQLVHTFLHEDNITLLDFIGKLPSGMCCILIRFGWINLAFHCGLHLILGRVLGQVSNLTPADSHYTKLIEFIPFGCSVTRSINPIALRINIIIC